jgi:hypothetical protein
MPEKRIPTKLRRLIEERARGCCEYCCSQDRFATHPFSVEHIRARVRGGKNTVGNLAYACQGCNNSKYDKVEGEDPLTGENAPLFHPRQDVWREHFIWTKQFTIIQGLTPTGRPTVSELRLNRESVVNLRRVLYLVGEHPPPKAENAV